MLSFGYYQAMQAIELIGNMYGTQIRLLGIGHFCAQNVSVSCISII